MPKRSSASGRWAVSSRVRRSATGSGAIAAARAAAESGITSARRARARLAAASAANREGAAPSRTGPPMARRVAASTPSSVPPCTVFNPPAKNQAVPGGPDSTAAPMFSSAATFRSQASATPAGSGATSRNVAQRASASPSRSPARTP
jgi:hypothetical protein